jgi:phage replication O-like protein O
MAIRDKEFYTRSNKILEKLAKTDLSINQGKYCFALFRKTFGYGKYADRISRLQFKGLTGILEVNISRVRRELKVRNIIHKKGEIEGFNLNTDLWVTVSGSILLVTVSGSIPNSISQAEDSSIGADTYKELTKNSTKKGGVGLKKLSYKEAEKLEGKTWLKQVMWQRSNFSIKFIDEIFGMYDFMTCYNAYIAFQEAHNVRKKEAWILARLERGPEPEV